MEQHGKVSYEMSEEEMELRRGPWTVDEDFTLINYIAHHGEGRWNSLARCAGLKRTGKSCRLRWLNYLRPDVRRGNITLEEQLLILELHSRWGNRWSKIAQHLPGRTDNEIKNYWRTRVQKHAKQLKCDVNSKQFKDTMRYLWMPRLVERIQASAAAASTGGVAVTTTAVASSSTTTHQLNTQNCMNLDMGPAQIVLPRTGINYTPENSTSSDSFGTPGSDLTECYNNYGVNHQRNSSQDNYYPASQDYYPVSQGNNQDYLINQAGMVFGMDQQNNGNSQWMDGGDHVSQSLWDVDDMWFSQGQFNSNV